MLTELASTPISQTIETLVAGRCSGDLQVCSGRIVKVVFFDHGRLVFAASNRKKDRLGEALITLGCITDEEFHRVSALMATTQRPRFGDALVEAGVMSRDEVGHSVAQWVRRIVLSLFELEGGAVSFEERQCPIPLEFMVSLSAPRLLHDGILTMSDAELVLAGIGPLDRMVARSAGPPFAFDAEQCSPDETAVLEQANGHAVTVRRLATLRNGISFPRLRAAYALLASGVLAESDGIAEPPPARVPLETSTFLVSALERKPDQPSRDAIRDEVAGEVARSEGLDGEAWLEVPRAAPREVLVRALEQRIERYHGLRDAVGDDEKLKTEIELLVGRATSLLRVTRGDMSKPARRAEPAATPAVRPEIDQLLMEADVYMTVSNYARAIPVYQKVVELRPDVVAYRVRLAVAMARWPATARQAEVQFLEAIRLEPSNADLHFRLSLYYKAMNARTQTFAALQKAVELDPGHKLARAEIAAFRSRESALIGLKKLLR
jgi:hypothetical protein